MVLYKKFCKKFELDVDNLQEDSILAFIMWLKVIGLASQTLHVLQIVINNLHFKGKKNFKKLLAVRKAVLKNKAPNWL